MKLKLLAKKSFSIALILSLTLAQSASAFAAETDPNFNISKEVGTESAQFPEEEPSEKEAELPDTEEETIGDSASAEANFSEDENTDMETLDSEPSEDAEVDTPLIQAETNAHMTGSYIPGDLDKDTPVYDSGISMYGSIPSSWDNRSCYPDNRNQNPYGTCWAFSTLGLAEFDLINKGYADSSIDLSELQLIYFTFNSALDPLGGTKGDQSKFYNSASYNFLNYGGNYENAARRLAQWSGAVKESLVPYSQASGVAGNGLADEYAYTHDSYLLKNAYRINIAENTDAVKSNIMEHGAAGVMYYHNDASMLWNSDKNLWTYYDTDYSGGGHAVMIVGWDDNFSRDNFPGVNKPNQDGAWLIRNSWGAYVNYFWMSYETKSLSTAAWFFDFGPADEYDNNYQLDGGLSTYYDTWYTHEANVFQVQSSSDAVSETLKAVQLSFTHVAGVNYTIDVYTDLANPQNPLSGQKQEEASVSGQTGYAGIYTIDLENSVKLKPGSYFSIVVSLDRNGMDYEQSISYADGDTNVWSCPATAAEGSYGSPDGENYYRWSMNGNFCIKALTADTQEVIPEPEPEPDPEPTPEERLDALAAEHKDDVPDGAYFIRSAVDDNYVLDVSGGSGENCANVQLYTRNDSNAQKWIIGHDAKGYLILTNAGSLKALDVSNAAIQNGTNIQQYESNSSKAQKWIGVRQSDGSVLFISALDKSKCVDLKWGTATNGTNIQLYESNGSKAQHWILSQKTLTEELAEAHRDDVKGGTYVIKSAVNQAYVLDVVGGSRDNRANVQLYEGNGTDAQKWKISHDADGYLIITNVGSGRVLDVNNASNANGTNIQQYDSNGSKAQKWIGVKQADGSIELISALDKTKCMDVSNGTAKNSSNIQLYTANNSKAQRWILVQNLDLDELATDHRDDVKNGTYTIYPAVNQNYALDVSGGSKSNCANIQVYTSNGTNAQKWRVTHDSKGYLTLTNVGSGKVLDVNGAATANGTNIQQYDSNSSKAQKWIGIRQSDGSIVLISALDSQKCIDLSSGQAVNGANVQLYGSNGTKAQRWVFH